MNISPLFLRFLLTASLSATLVAVHSTVAAETTPMYRVVDEQGHVTYTDSPPANSTSEPIKLSPINTQPAAVTPQTQKQPEQAVGAAYTVSRITQPAQDTTVPPGQLDVIVQIELEPQLQPGHLVKLYHNGRLYGAPTSASSFSLTSLIRGQHQVQAEIVDADGNIKATTQTVVFHVKRASAQQPKAQKAK